VATASDRVLTLAAFRGSTRPVLLVGGRGYLQKAEAAAAPYRDALRQRAVSLVFLPLEDADDPSEKLKSLKAKFKCAQRLSPEMYSPTVCCTGRLIFSGARTFCCPGALHSMRLVACAR